MRPDARQADAAIAATWPGRAQRRVGPWIIRQGDAGGRSRAAFLVEPYAPGQVGVAEAAIAAQGDSPLFRVRDWDGELAAELAASGYAELDPTLVLAADPAALAEPEPSTGIEGWPPVALMEEIWADGGIGPARIATMDRFEGPRTAILVRDGQRPAALCHVNLHDGIAVVHAVHTVPHLRGRGRGRQAMLCAARWARQQGAGALLAPVAAVNAPARALYASLGLVDVGGYRYHSKDGSK